MVTPKELSRRIINFYQTSGKIYGNHTPIYKNDAPICHNLESSLNYIFGISPDVYEKIVSFSDTVFNFVKTEAIRESLDMILENCPEEYKEPIKFIIDWLKSSSENK